MAQLAYLIPHRLTAPPWSADLEPVDLELEAGIALPLLGTIAAGLPIVEQRQSAENGETVVAKINSDQVTLKRFFIETDGIRLQPAHPDMAPIYIRHEELEILGIVTGVMRLAA